MKSFTELQRAIEEGEPAFERFIRTEIAADRHFLKRRFLFKEAEQITVLNYLIYKHETGLGKPDRRNHINRLLVMGADFNSDCSIHLLLRLKKWELFPVFFQDSHEEVERDSFASQLRRQLRLDSRDIYGRTLLSRAISAGRASILSTLLESESENELQIDAPNQIHVSAQRGQNIDLQPLHQAVVNDFPEAIYQLLAKGAIINNPCGLLRETPLLLAARLGKIKSLEVLFSATVGKNCFDLQAENNESENPINLLCKCLERKENSQETLYGIAMLLCHGAKVPQEESIKSLLIKNRFALIDAVKKYKDRSGNSAALFVRACHDKNNPLHDIIYANTWLHVFWRYSSLQWLWHLLGFNCDEAFRIEALVYEGPDSKAASAEVRNKFRPLQSVAINNDNKQLAAVSALSEEKEEIALDEGSDYTRKEHKFAEFTWRYGSTCRFFKAPWSTMYRNLTLGEYTNIDQILDYSKKQEHETTTTRTVINAMYPEEFNIHENLLPLEDGVPQRRNIT